MIEILNIGKENKLIITVYIALLSVVSTAYFLLVAMRAEGYDPEAWGKAYMYFMLFSFVLFSVLLPFWKTGGAGRGKYLKMLGGVLVFTLSPIPLILMILVLGKLSGVNFMLVLAVQALWGTGLLSFKSALEALRIKKWKGFLLAVFIFAVLVLLPVFLYFFVEYNRTVITTVFDKRIPFLFLLNPLHSAAGLLNAQTGGQVQGGYMPYPACLLFWTLFSCVNMAISIKYPQVKERRRNRT
ncbi:MAG: hypothetical protein QHH06_07130 [Clostridiales bacterium]|jgi:hypothetical protein|nr:hypothetical protein [Eubacteriales bacterium]MDH7566240.1 hypothetical protein [Clostridiales bacterium]